MTVSQLDLESIVRDRVNRTNTAIRELASVNSHLLESYSSDTGFSAGSIVIESAAIWTNVKVNKLQIPTANTTEIHFSGSAWGVGIGVFNIAGVGYFAVSADDLLNEGSVNFQFTVGAIGGGVGEILFTSSSSKFLGFLAGPVLGIGAGSFGGSGNFKSGPS